MKRIKQLFIIASMLWATQGYAQMKYVARVETGLIGFMYNPIRIDPGPDWKGYYLSDKNGIDLNFINAITFNNKLHIGLGVGYLNFEGINGLSVFSDFESVPLKSKLSPLFNLKIGYSHLWNQYENGTGSALVEFNLGVNCRPKEKMNVFLKSGFLITQQSLLLPIRLGLRF